MAKERKKVRKKEEKRGKEAEMIARGEMRS